LSSNGLLTPKFLSWKSLFQWKDFFLHMKIVKRFEFQYFPYNQFITNFTRFTLIPLGLLQKQKISLKFMVRAPNKGNFWRGCGRGKGRDEFKGIKDSVVINLRARDLNLNSCFNRFKFQKSNIKKSQQIISIASLFSTNLSLHYGYQKKHVKHPQSSSLLTLILFNSQYTSKNKPFAIYQPSDLDIYHNSKENIPYGANAPSSKLGKRDDSHLEAKFTWTSDEVWLDSYWLVF